MRRLITILVASVAVLVAAPAMAGLPDVADIQLIQTGGTYDGVMAMPGDTLELTIEVTLFSGITFILIDPGPVWTGGVDSFDAAGSSEISFLTDPGLNGFLAPIVSGTDIKEVVPLQATDPGAVGQADGWEVQNVSGATTTTDVTFDIGIASFVLDGMGGEIEIGVGGYNFGTVVSINDGEVVNATDQTIKGSFTIVPEPTMAASSLAVLASLGGLAAYRRRS